MLISSKKGGKGREGKGKEGKGRERKGREGKARQGKARQVKEIDNASFLPCFWRVCYLKKKHV